MQLEEFLSLLGNPRRLRHGWMGQCPAHDDCRNSLKIDEGDDGRILLHCFAACSTEDVLRSLGLEFGDLFKNPISRRGQCITPSAPRPRRDIRDTSGKLEDHAMTLRIRGGRVLGVARDLSIRCWSSKDLDRALGAVAQAYADRDRAQLLEDVAFELRSKRLKQNQEAHASRA